jgi:PAS domain S-box-containing protein
VADAPLIQTQIRTGKPIAIPDVSVFPEWRYFNEESHWIRAYVGAPILYQGELLGLINLDGGTPGMFDEQHAERLEAFANQAAIALQNARRAEELEQRVAERTAELDSQRKQLQILLDATAEGIMYSENGLIRYFNPAFLKITGSDPLDLIGQPVSILWGQTTDAQNRQRLESIWDIVAEGQVWRGEAKLMRKDGAEYDAAMTVSRVGEAGEKPFRAITLLRDVSKEKELEAQKARFIANAAHELSSPISSLSLRLSLMQRYPDRIEEHLTMLDGITQRMKRLVEDLLDISRFEHGKISLQKQSVVVQNLVADVVKMYRPEADSKHLQLQFEPSSAPILVSADPERLTQVLTNLITNAIQYTPEGGYIQVTTAVEGNGQPLSQLAVVAVRDTGKGIPADDLPYIFQPFYRVDDSRKGMGLGLSISKEIVDMHGGQISVESEFGSGSSFYIRLPIVDEY